MDKHRADVRQASGISWFDELLQDLRYGLRSLARNPGYAALAIVTLGLGIGANTAIFSVINGVLLKPLPYEHGDRLMVVRQSAPLAGQATTGVAIAEYFDYRDQARDVFDGMVEYHQMSFDLLNRGEPDRVNTGVVSANFFDLLGIRPILGRTFVASDDQPGAEAVLVLSHTYWRTRFGGDASIIGQVFEMNDRPHRVIGVLPNVPGFLKSAHVIGWSGGVMEPKSFFDAIYVYAWFTGFLLSGALYLAGMRLLTPRRDVPAAAARG